MPTRGHRRRRLEGPYGGFPPSSFGSSPLGTGKLGKGGQGKAGFERAEREDEHYYNMIEQQSRMTQQTAIGFQGYVVETVDPFRGFNYIVITYCLLAFVLIYPFVICLCYVRETRKKRASTVPPPVKQDGDTVVVVPPPSSELLESFGGGNGKATQEADAEHMTNLDQPVPITPTTTKSTEPDDPDKLVSDTMPTIPAVGLPNSPVQVLVQASTRSSSQHPPPQPPQASQVASSSGILSRIPSAATTGRLHAGTGRGSTAAWPRPRHSRRPSGDPSWHWRRAIQTERRHRSRRMEIILARNYGTANPNQITPAPNGNNNNVLFRLKSGAVGVMSDLANTVLTAEQKESQQQHRQQQQQPHFSSSKVSPHQQHPAVEPVAVEPALYSRQVLAARQRRPSKPQLPSSIRRPSNGGSVRSGSLRSAGGGGGAYSSSILSSIVDDISPNDAADADDPGKVRILPGSPHSPDAHAHRSHYAAACCMVLEPWLDVAEPNEELHRLAGLAFPVTVGAMAEPVARCILMGLISHKIGTHAMVAYLLVQLLYRMTGETLSVAITDAESTLVQMALTSTANTNGQPPNSSNPPTFTREGYKLAGQYVQLACFLQLIFVGAIVVAWYFFIEDVIVWWVDSEDMASLAKEYFQIILFLFLVQSLYRAIIVPCHMRGSEHSTVESIMDFAVTAISLITIGVVLSKTANMPSEYPDVVDQHPENPHAYTYHERQEDSRRALITIAWIQVNLGIAACVLKVAFCVVKGWLDHFWCGLLQGFALLNIGAFCNLLVTSIPLIFGAILELGEVDLLTLFVRCVGPAEVAAWAMFASLWDVLEASTEGISEAAAVRVAFHLSTSQPDLAKKLSHKALFWIIVQALIFTSILLLAGRQIIVSLTVDYTLQHLLDQLMGLMALANLCMSFAQVCWSLVGAQGRFNLATLVMLCCRWILTMPLALIFIFAMNYDEETLAGAVAIGSATSACVLSAILFSSDWNEVAHELYLQGLLTFDDDDDFDFSFGDDDESDGGEDDDDNEEDSFCVRASGYPSNLKSMDETDSGDLPLSTEPTTRTETNTGSGVNSGAGSGVISGADSGLTSGLCGA